MPLINVILIICRIRALLKHTRSIMETLGIVDDENSIGNYHIPLSQKWQMCLFFLLDYNKLYSLRAEYNLDINRQAAILMMMSNIPLNRKIMV